MGLPSLNEAGHTHVEVVGGLHVGGFIEIMLALPSLAEAGTRQGGENAVPRAVGEEVGLHLDESLGGHLVARHRQDAAVTAVGAVPLLHLGVHAGAVEEQGDIPLPQDEIVQHRVPDVEVLGGVAAEILQSDLLHDTRLAVVLAVGTADPHTDLGGGVAPENGTLLHEYGLSTATRRRDGRADACHTAADDTEIGGKGDGFQHDGFLLG